MPYACYRAESATYSPGVRGRSKYSWILPAGVKPMSNLPREEAFSLTEKLHRSGCKSIVSVKAIYHSPFGAVLKR